MCESRHHLVQRLLAPRSDPRVQTLLTLYGTAHLRRPDGPDAAWLAWERAGLAATCDSRVRVADVGEFFTRHLITTYGVRPDRFVPWRSSLDLRAADLQPMPREGAVSVLTTYGVPTDRPIVAFIGRTDPCKGLGHLINALVPIRDRIHLAAIVTPTGPDDPLAHEYRRRIAAAGLRATYVPRFTRELPRALCSLPLTRAVACPARGEVLANVPFEVALWARNGGPIVVAPDRDGFPEQIDHGRTGLLYNPSTAGALTAALIRAIELPDGERRLICATAERLVRNERDVVANLGGTLRAMWGDPPCVR